MGQVKGKRSVWRGLSPRTMYLKSSLFGIFILSLFSYNLSGKYLSQIPFNSWFTKLWRKLLNHLQLVNYLLLTRMVNIEKKIECVRTGDSNYFTKNVSVLNSKYEEGVCRNFRISFLSDLHMHRIEIEFWHILYVFA